MAFLGDLIERYIADLYGIEALQPDPSAKNIGIIGHSMDHLLHTCFFNDDYILQIYQAFVIMKLDQLLPDGCEVLVTHLRDGINEWALGINMDRPALQLLLIAPNDIDIHEKEQQIIDQAHRLHRIDASNELDLQKWMVDHVDHLICIEEPENLPILQYTKERSIPTTIIHASELIKLCGTIFENKMKLDVMRSVLDGMSDRGLLSDDTDVTTMLDSLANFHMPDEQT